MSNKIINLKWYAYIANLTKKSLGFNLCCCYFSYRTLWRTLRSTLAPSHDVRVCCDCVCEMVCMAERSPAFWHLMFAVSLLSLLMRFGVFLLSFHWLCRKILVSRSRPLPWLYRYMAYSHTADVRIFWAKIYICALNKYASAQHTYYLCEQSLRTWELQVRCVVVVTSMWSVNYVEIYLQRCPQCECVRVWVSSPGTECH